jgi:hypothetical protein
MLQTSNLFPEFPDHSKVWLYQSDRAFTLEEKSWLTHQLSQFISEWAAHGTKLMADAMVLGDYHIVLVVDEQVFGASGCSLDTSTRFIKTLGTTLSIDFFNRLSMLIESNETVKLVPFSQLNEYENWMLYNPLVQNLKGLRNEWIILVADRNF